MADKRDEVKKVVGDEGQVDEVITTSTEKAFCGVDYSGSASTTEVKGWRDQIPAKPSSVELWEESEKKHQEIFGQKGKTLGE